MDRRIVYIGAIPQDLDILKVQRDVMVALGYMAEGVLGTSAVVDGLACTPTSPASLSVNIGRGQIYQQANIDTVPYGSVASDTVNQIIKQGIIKADTALTVTPPGTPGQAVNFLVQAAVLEQDIDIATLPYFNPASLTNPTAAPWSGPNNSGTTQPQTRQTTVQLSLKSGVAASAGTQTTPAPDVGYVGLYVITVAQGATQITNSQIAVYDLAPFINPKLPAVPSWTQSGVSNYALDTGTANALVVKLSPVPASYGAGGLTIKVKKGSSANSGATTINVNGLGTKSIVKPAGTALTGGEIPANTVFEIVYDGTQFYLQTAQATNTNNSTGGLTAVATQSPISGDGTGGNPVKVDDATTGGKGAIQLANAAAYTGNSADRGLTPNAVWDAAGFITQPSAGSFTPDFSVGFNWAMTLNSAFTLNNPSNAKSGQTGAIALTQDATGGRALNFPGDKVWMFPGGFGGLSTAPNAVDVIVYKVITPTFIIASLLKGVV